MATTTSERPLSERASVSPPIPDEAGPERPCPGAEGGRSQRQPRRTCLRKLSEGQRARRLTFYRNGDRFDKGITYVLSLEKVRTFNALLEDLTRVMTALPRGVRYVFTADGREKVTQLESLQEGESYVCASVNRFIRLKYGKQEAPPQWRLSRSTRGIPGVLSSKGCSSGGTECPNGRDFVRPKLVTVMRNGTRPRKAVRILLNHRTAHSIEQVLDDVTQVIQLNSGAVRNIFTLGGKQVTCLADFFGSEDVFIAYGAEKYSHDDFYLDSEERKIINSIRKTPALCRKERRFYSGRSMSPVLDVPSNLSFRSSDSATDDRHQDVAGAVRYTVKHMVGDGTFAKVYQCVEKRTGITYALKIIDKKKYRGKEEMIASEVSILQRVKHPNIVKLVEVIDYKSKIYLVTELVKGGDLFSAFEAARQFTEPVAASMLCNLASALNYIHQLGVVHRDIKPENLLVDQGGQLKLADFGLAVEIPADGSPLFTVCGTPTYVAPEVLAQTGYGTAVDVWAAGVITYMILCGFPPFVSHANNEDELFDLIQKGQFKFMSPYWDDVTESAKELITHMLQVDINERFTAKQVLDHPWLVMGGIQEEKRVEQVQGNHFDERPRDPSRASGIPVYEVKLVTGDVNKEPSSET